MPEDFIGRYGRSVLQLIDALDQLQALKGEYDALSYSSVDLSAAVPEHFTSQDFKDAVASAEALRATFNTGHNTNLHRIKAL
jgi:hypothetical protein